MYIATHARFHFPETTKDAAAATFYERYKPTIPMTWSLEKFHHSIQHPWFNQAKVLDSWPDRKYR